MDQFLLLLVESIKHKGKHMEQAKVFGIINKINSILFLLLLVGGFFLIVSGMFLSSSWQDKRAVEVVQNDAEGKQEKIELILDDIENIPGSDTQYVHLKTKRSGGKFSSYSGGGETRNVLFFTGSKLNTHWLYQNHIFNILKFAILKQCKKNNKNKALAIYIETAKSDSDGDNLLNEDDLITISLTDVNGENLTEVDSNVQSVIDKNVVEDGSFLILLMQKDNQVLLKKYSLSTFKLVSEKLINEISKKL